MDALAKSLSTNQSVREICNNLPALAEKVFEMEVGARDACVFLQQEQWGSVFIKAVLMLLLLSDQVCLNLHSVTYVCECTKDWTPAA